MTLYDRVRPALFRMDAERAHESALRGLALASSSRLALRALRATYASGTRDGSAAVEAFGLRFPNPVGLAAGLDKDAVALPALAALGFGFLEVGTVTAEPQPGNERPRLFRLLEDEALINRMGFNNRGAAALAERVLRAKAAHGDWLPPIGVNVGKSRSVPVEEAPADYRASLTSVWAAADYLVINVSSPNTPGLRDLQAAAALRAVLAQARDVASQHGSKPVLVKLSPDLSEDSLVEAAHVAQEEGAAGIIATNTTITRPGSTATRSSESGGLSGRPLAPLALDALRRLVGVTDLPVISVGGVADSGDVSERLDAGATLVQVYTSFVYRGPGLPGDLARAVIAERD